MSPHDLMVVQGRPSRRKALPSQTTEAWTERAARLVVLLDEAESRPGALWDAGLSRSEEIVREALGYGMSDDPFFDANALTRQALVRLTARLGVVERKRKDLAVVLRWSERLDLGVEEFLSAYVTIEGRTLRWDALESACSSVVSRVAMLAFRLERASPDECETERRYAMQHVRGQLELLAWRFEQLCHARAFVAAAASALAAARDRHRGLLSNFHDDPDRALQGAGQRCTAAAQRIDAALLTWATRIDRMQHQLHTLQASETLLGPAPQR